MSLCLLGTGLSVAGWTIDPASGKACPVSVGEWSNFRAAGGFLGGNPSHLFQLQESGGSPVDSIGSLPTTVQGLSYQQTITGWTRKAIRPGTTIGDGSYVAPGNGAPNPSTTSYARLVYVDLGTVPVSPNVPAIIWNGSNSSDVGIVRFDDGGTTKLRFRSPGGLTDTTTTYTAGTVYVLLHVFDRTNSLHKLYTNLEKLTATYGAASSQTYYGLVGAEGAGGTCGVLYDCCFTGAAAEYLSTDATVKSLLQALGWTIPWS